MGGCVPMVVYRAIKPADLPQCEALSHAFLESELRRMMKDGAIGFVCERRGRQIAFLVLRRGKWDVEILDFGWDEDHGMEMEHLVEMAKNFARDEAGFEVSAVVPERHLDAQLLLRRCEFFCDGIIDGAETYYRFAIKKGKHEAKL